ncbi:AAA family ATPase [Mesorhizobium sp.]|uniref:AAA family ATPase n=1 Tax=Mesorhizobium sp. TaxID=1871066 RepID=UPI000FE7C621|nr:AAA family ATPase [Mesorhizobium sp.]RWP75836.1 MAG: ATP-binding protein [Mesorhizobium sp.]
MHISRLRMSNIRSINDFELSLNSEEFAGWHVILGDNGAGKSTVIRSIALSSIGPLESQALRQDWSNWLQNGRDSGRIEADIVSSDHDSWVGKGKTSNATIKANIAFQLHSGNGVDSAQASTLTGKVEPPKFSGRMTDRTIWGTGTGWFSASFGPYRRFSGGDLSYDRMFYSNPRAAPHLSAFGEDVALTEALRWLQQLHVRSLEGNELDQRVKDAIVDFVNKFDFLPHKAKIDEISSEKITIKDGDLNVVSVNQMSDGYRSILSLTFELLRQMFRQYGAETVLKNLDNNLGAITLPGVVAIDEIDAHLHPAWQKRIGEWFVTRFPQVQFFVTTHSPIICQAAAKGSVWRLPTPGTTEEAGRVTGDDLNKLIYGSILDAFGTQFFGIGVTRSDASKEKLLELARLNRKSLSEQLDTSDQNKLEELRATLPSVAAKVADEM